ncbi:MAG: sensor histidine kinase N-terminal domain-containing protein [Burkholderiales bacterium]
MADAGSLRTRLFAWLLVPMAALAVVSAGAAYYTAFQFANEVYDRWISDTAISLSQLSREEGGHILVDLPTAAQHMIASDQRDRIYYKVSDLEGRFIAGHRALPSPSPTPYAGAEPLCLDGIFNGDPVRIAAYRPATLPVIVQVAETVTKRDVLAFEIIAGMLVPLILLLIFGAGALWLGVERGVHPLTEFAEQLRGRSPQDLRALDMSTAPREVRPLVHALNGLLERVDEMVTSQRRFVADAAHQLRTPIAGLKTQAEMALRTRDPDALRATLDNVVSGASRMSSLVAQLLSLARAEPEAEGLRAAESVDIDALSRAVTADWIPMALERGIDLGFEGAAAPVHVRGSGTMLREMLGNVIDNALKFSPAGSMATVSVAAEGSAARITVTDDGPGVPVHERERVFERFHRVADSTIPGTGLGLAIVREIAAAHGGTASLDAAPDGHGTRVTLQFPALPDPLPD